jgi:hypothetical protein
MIALMSVAQGFASAQHVFDAGLSLWGFQKIDEELTFYTY